MVKSWLFPICVLALVGALIPPMAGPASAGSLRDAMALEEAMAWSDKAYVQGLLQWSGDYRGRADGDFGPGTRKAIEQYQRRNDRRVTGYLTPDELRDLEKNEGITRSRMGFEIRDFPEIGITIGLPMADLGEEPEADSIGLNFWADEGMLPTATLHSFDAMPAGDFRRLFDEAMPRGEFVRDVYEVFRGGWFVFTGLSHDGIIQYTYMANTPDGVRGFTFQYFASEAELFGRMPVVMLESLQTYAAKPGSGRAAGTARPGDAAGVSGSTKGGSSSDAAGASGGDGTRRSERPALDGPVIATGSGFYVNQYGSVLTNHHVIEGCRRLRVNGDLAAEPFRSDRELDLAILSVGAGEDTPFLWFREKPARLNEDVTVVGFPLYGILDRINVTRGSVSSLAGLDGDTRMIQITAPVQSGNSGGPVLDATGRVVGVVQSKLDTLKLANDMGEIAQNINFAIDGQLAQGFLQGTGAGFFTGDGDIVMSPPDLAEHAQLATVLIECIGQ